MTVPSTDDIAAAKELLDGLVPKAARFTWRPPDPERVTIEIHPAVREALERLLVVDPQLRKVGYSAFIMDAVKQWLRNNPTDDDLRAMYATNDILDLISAGAMNAS